MTVHPNCHLSIETAVEKSHVLWDAHEHNKQAQNIAATAATLAARPLSVGSCSGPSGSPEDE